jgi:hypothetical protein
MAQQSALRFSHFQEMQKQNPHEYYTPRTQAKMARSYQAQGLLFFDLEGHRH